jgi:hypothetical protein
MELQETPKLDQGGTTAELTQPARSLKKKIKDATRKPQGRKAFRTRKQAKYHNWFTPFVFKQIENARIAAGGPNWSSTRAIEHELIKRDPVIFKDFSDKLLMNGSIAHKLSQGGRTRPLLVLNAEIISAMLMVDEKVPS